MKIDKTQIAKECNETFNELGIKADIKQDFIFLSPPEKVPTELMEKIFKCKKQLIKLLTDNES